MRLLTVLLIALVAPLAACGRIQRSGPAITLPHTVATVGPLELVIESWGTDTLGFVVACVDDGPVRDVQVRVATADGQTTVASKPNADSRTCDRAHPPLLRGTAAALDLEPGEPVTISLQVSADQNGGVVATEETRHYVVGSDERLHPVTRPPSAG